MEPGIIRAIQRALAFLLIIASFLMVGACANSEGGALFKGAKGEGYYGNFCGPNHPTVKQNGSISAVSQLEAIQPIDHLDAACKGHDICYAAGNMSTAACDQQLVSYVKTARWTTICNGRAHTIAQGFPDTLIDFYSYGPNAKPSSLNVLTPINYVLTFAANVVFLPLTILGGSTERCYDLNQRR